MRFSSSTVLAALPALAAAQDSPIDQYKAQFQNVIGQFASYIPNPGHHDPVAAAEAKAGSMRLNVLTLENWKQTLYEPVSAGATSPEEWWLLISGGNKTCYGRCGIVEQAFNETAAKFALLDNTPHMAYLNCDNQPILCNAWSAGPASLYIIEMLPEPAPVEIYSKRLNLTTTTSDTLVAFHESGSKDQFHRIDSSWFHPFNGKLAEYGVAVPFGYLMWAMGLIPNWLFMLVVSFGSRAMMSRRMQGANGAPQAGAQRAQ
ncbi:peptidyl-tRNA hydrolase [Fusarium sp. NRRL 25303]|nr:peptidyl-tRNA hydrolase [Fusarium sp. NRRL 25303]